MSDDEHNRPPLAYLLNEDGHHFEDLDQTARTLGSLGNEERAAYRDANAQAIAEAAAVRLLIVAGPRSEPRGQLTTRVAARAKAKSRTRRNVSLRLPGIAQRFAIR